MTKSEKEKNAALNGGRGSGQSVRILADAFEAKIADIKANCDLAIEGRDVKIKELEEDVRNKKIAIKNRNAEIKLLGERCNQLLKDKGDLIDENRLLIQENEEMKKGLGCETCQITEEYKTLNDKIRSLEQQIEKMKEEHQQNELGLIISNSSARVELNEKIEQLEKENAGLKAQIEKMKNCQNCKFEDLDCLTEPCSVCGRLIGEDIKREGTFDKWEIKENE